MPRKYEPKRQCTAHNAVTGLRCRQGAILGGTVCFHHGGKAKHVRDKARERLRELVHPAIEALADMINLGAQSEDKSAVIRAALAVLDRCGYEAKSGLEVSGPHHGPADLRAQEFRMEDFSIETRRMMLRDMERAAERRALQAAQEETEDQDDQ